ncbi:MAG: hypothetical protein KAY37_02660 [Phycisphaerae bacterium]|nr:hypothetical protein [Phycisphaerae bacterium]
MDKQQIYRHGDLSEGYYPLSWSPIFGCWSVGEPGFSDTTDPAYGFPPEIELSGTPNMDYQIWFEILDISPNLKIRMDDGAWLWQIGDCYNLSTWAEHHVHMKYRAYVPQDPPPDYPFWVTYRLYDELGPYEASEPFICVFNEPAPAVEATLPAYEGTLESLAGAVLQFEFHRAVTVDGGPPVIITDVETQTQDYYTCYFDYEVSPEGLVLTLNQIAGTLPNETWLQISLTEYLKDAVEDRPVVPFTQYVYTSAAGGCLGDCDCDGLISWRDIDYFVAAMNDNVAAWEAMFAPGWPSCPFGNNDVNNDGTVSWRDIDLLVALMNSTCP